MRQLNKIIASILLVALILACEETETPHKEPEQNPEHVFENDERIEKDARILNRLYNKVHDDIAKNTYGYKNSTYYVKGKIVPYKGLWSDDASIFEEVFAIDAENIEFRIVIETPEGYRDKIYELAKSKQTHVFRIQITKVSDGEWIWFKLIT